MPQTRASSSSKVRYQIFRGGRQVYEASVEEVLASALRHNWIIVKASQRPPGPNAIWCPSLQPTLLEKGEIAKELRGLRNLVVVDASDALWQPKINEIVAAESAYVNMQSLLQAEASRKKIRINKSRKKERGKGREDALGDAHQGIQQAGKEKGEDDEMLVKAQEDVLTAAGKEEGGADVQRVEQGIQQVTEAGKENDEMLVKAQEDVLMAEQTTAGKEKGGDEIEKDVVTAEDVLMPEQRTEEVTTTGKEKGGNGVKTQRDEGQLSCKEDDVLFFDDLFFEDGKIMHKGIGLEMMTQFLKGMQGLQKGMQGLQKGLQNLQHDMQGLRKDVQAIHKSLSSTSERVSRLSLALLHGQYSGARVEYPVTTRWIPYNPMTMNTQDLEHLAVLCKPLPKDTTKAKPSGLVEVDILIKILKEDARHKVYTSPMTVKTSRLFADRPSSFTHVVLGESSRSMDLCASAAEYKHPEKPCRTSSAKLLKKLVQVERGIVATLYYYDAPGYGALVDAAAIISPSFRQLTDPDSLLCEVLSCTQALPNVARLARERKMWLVDA